MSALNESLSDREVDAIWRANIREWVRAHYEDAGVRQARHVTERYEVSQARAGMRLVFEPDPDYRDDDWKEEIGR